MGMRDLRTGSADSGGRERTSAWIPWVFVGFFVVVFGANAAMVAFALTTWTGVETDTPYEDGVVYQKVLDAEHRQAELGWKVDLAFEAKDRDHAAGAGTRRGGDGAHLPGGAWPALSMRAAAMCAAAMAPRGPYR